NRLAVFSIERGCPVTVEPIAGGANGFYSPAEHRITIAKGLAPDQAAKTLAHEIGHSLLHRDIEVYREHRGDCELEAESTAYVVLQHFGLNAGQYSFGYVASWAGGDEAAIKALKACAGRVQKTARTIISGIEDRYEAEDTAA
ncbi:MAG: ImmA/IrrE family metallo-endopeptidase, partial [Cyanobacteria bacterium REEB65]|nr:ImmA/IrrE family metallo-endopeptidase [Cyanobacteria bacterium REEB65]